MHHHAVGTPLALTATLWGIANQLFAVHADIYAWGALLGGAGTLILAVVSAAREVRAWMDRPRVKLEDAAHAAVAKLATAAEVAKTVLDIQAKDRP